MYNIIILQIDYKHIPFVFQQPACSPHIVWCMHTRVFGMTHTKWYHFVVIEVIKIPAKQLYHAMGAMYVRQDISISCLLL